MGGVDGRVGSCGVAKCVIARRAASPTIRIKTACRYLPSSVAMAKKPMRAKQEMAAHKRGEREGVMLPLVWHGWAEGGGLKLYAGGGTGVLVRPTYAG